jgi:hypothetical protein
MYAIPKLTYSIKSWAQYFTGNYYTNLEKNTVLNLGDLPPQADSHKGK